jgi:hypothetical protein
VRETDEAGDKRIRAGRDPAGAGRGRFWASVALIATYTGTSPGSWASGAQRQHARGVFSDRARDDHELVEYLNAMMAEGNRVVGLKKSAHFDPFDERVEHYLATAEPGSLSSLFKDAGCSEEIKVTSQPTHWLFAMKDTLAANTFRALAALVVHPEAQQRMREP